MREIDEIMADARDRPPFSNSDDGGAWQANWCRRPCVHDAAFQRGERGADGCPLLLTAVLGQTPVEWFEQPFAEWGRGEGRYHCVEYRSEEDGPGPEPQPVPDPPGQGTLLPRALCEGVRMLTPLPAEVLV